MRGKTVKKINKFVDILINNTPEEERIKSRSEMIKEVRKFWRGNKEKQKFVNIVVVAGEDISYTVEKKGKA